MCVLLLDPSLNNGVTFVSFHSDGTIPSLSDKLINIANGILFAKGIQILGIALWNYYRCY